MEDTLYGRQPLMKDDLWQKTGFDGRWPWTEDDLWRKMTFDGRRSLGDALTTATLWPFFWRLPLSIIFRNKNHINSDSDFFLCILLEKQKSDHNRSKFLIYSDIGALLRLSEPVKALPPSPHKNSSWFGIFMAASVARLHGSGSLLLPERKKNQKFFRKCQNF